MVHENSPTAMTALTVWKMYVALCDILVKSAVYESSYLVT